MAFIKPRFPGTPKNSECARNIITDPATGKTGNYVDALVGDARQLLDKPAQFEGN